MGFGKKGVSVSIERYTEPLTKKQNQTWSTAIVQLPDLWYENSVHACISGYNRCQHTGTGRWALNSAGVKCVMGKFGVKDMQGGLIPVISYQM